MLYLGWTASAKIRRLAVPSRSRAASPGAELPAQTVSLRRGLKTSERIARSIVQTVAAAGLQPGDRLPNEAEMLSRYGVGRASLREALRILEVQGLVDIKPGPGGGPVLSKSSAREFGHLASLHFQFSGGTFGQLIDARQLLEPVLASQAAQLRDPEAFEGIKRALEIEAAGLPEELNCLGRASDFHRAVVTAANNVVLGLYSESLAEVVRERLMSRVLPMDSADRMHQDHVAIGKAIQRGEATKAQFLMSEHLGRYNKEYVESRLPGFLAEVIDWV
jgi:GntR family transcriptional regulator, transcriptional repressor for pyruvate dehydrogenase complex